MKDAPGVGPLLFQALVVPGMAEGQMTDFARPERFPVMVWPGNVDDTMIPVIRAVETLAGFEPTTSAIRVTEMVR